MKYLIILLVFPLVFSLNSALAESLWENRVDGMVRSVDITNNGAYIAATTEIADKKGDVYLFDNFGTILWKKDLDRIMGDIFISKDSSLVVASGYQLSDGRGKFYMNPSVYLFDIKGNLLWQYQNTDNPTIDTNNQFLRGTITPDNHIIMQSVHQIMLLDKSKNQMWNYTIGEDVGRIKISPDGSVIGVSSTDYSKDNTWVIHVLDSQGHLLWRHTGRDGILPWSAFSISSGGNKITVGSMPNGDTGTLYLFDKTGNMLWKHDVLGGVLNADMSDDGSSIIVGTNDGLSLFDSSGKKVSTNSTWAPDISPDGTTIVSHGQINDMAFGVTLFDGKLNQIWQKRIPDVSAAKLSDNSSFVVVGTSPVLATGSFGEVFLLEGNKNKTVVNHELPKTTKQISPLKQFKSGIPINQIQCKENYVVLLKPNKEFGGCFSSDSAMKLYARGWPSPNDSTGFFQKQIIKTPIKDSAKLDDKTSTEKRTIMYNESSYLSKVDLSASGIPRNPDGKINYDQLLYIVAKQKYTKIFEENNMSIKPNDIFLTAGPDITMYHESGYQCGYVNANNQTFWLESRMNKDTVTELRVFNDNPDKCRPSYGSCFCDAQHNLIEKAVKELSYFDESQVKQVGKAIQSYFNNGNKIANVPNSFIVGKYNMDLGHGITSFCGQFKGKPNEWYFHGSMTENNKIVVEFSLDLDEKQKLCVIKDNSEMFTFDKSTIVKN